MALYYSSGYFCPQKVHASVRIAFEYRQNQAKQLRQVGGRTSMRQGNFFLLAATISRKKMQFEKTKWLGKGENNSPLARGDLSTVESCFSFDRVSLLPGSTKVLSTFPKALQNYYRILRRENCRTERKRRIFRSFDSPTRGVAFIFVLVTTRGRAHVVHTLESHGYA